MAENVDVIGKLTGDFGKWQLKAVLIIFLIKIPASWFMAIIIYSAPAPKVGDFWCKPPQEILHNLTDFDHKQWIHMSHPKIQNAGGSKEFQLDFCNVYKDVYDNKEIYYQNIKNSTDSPIFENNIFNENRTIIPCETFHFNDAKTTIITEFNLVCSKKLLVTFSQCMHIFGLLIGGIIAYYLLKIFSPRRVILIGMISQIINGNICGWVNYFGLHVLFRSLSAVSCALMYSAGPVIVNDITLGRARTITIALFDLFWSFGLILLPSLSIFINNWTHLYMMISFPTIILMLLHRLIPDSPRWMLQHGKLNKVKEILIKAATANKIKIPNDIDHQILMQSIALSKQPPPKKWFDLWHGKPGKGMLLAIHYSWSICIVLFNAMVLNIISFGPKHININTMIIALSEMAGAFIGLYLILYTRRKWLWSGIFSIVAGLFAYLTWCIPEHLQLSHSVALLMIPCIILKMAVSIVLSILTTCTGELVTADKKKLLSFSVTVWARGWFFWVPFFGATRVYGKTIPLTIFATLSIINGLLFGYIYFGLSKLNRQKTRYGTNGNAGIQKDELLLKDKDRNETVENKI